MLLSSLFIRIKTNQTCQTHLVDSISTQSSQVNRTYFIKTLISPITPLLQVFCQLSSFTIVYYNIVFSSSSLTILDPVSENCRPPSHHIFFCRFNFSFFLLVRPPRSQSLLIMGWCSSIPEHRLRLHLDSGPIFNLSLLRLGSHFQIGSE